MLAMKTLLSSTLFVVVAESAQAQDILFKQPYINQDTLYNITPTDDRREGFHLWVWKPSFESNMPIKEYSFRDNKMNRDPLRKNLDIFPKLEEIIPEKEMPNPIKEDPENGSK
jgi:hypothetical protein